jgi:hypothetical protein
MERVERKLFEPLPALGESPAAPPPAAPTPPPAAASSPTT